MWGAAREYRSSYELKDTCWGWSFVCFFFFLLCFRPMYVCFLRTIQEWWKRKMHVTGNVKSYVKTFISFLALQSHRTWWCRMGPWMSARDLHDRTKTSFRIVLHVAALPMIFTHYSFLQFLLHFRLHKCRSRPSSLCNKAALNAKTVLADVLYKVLYCMTPSKVKSTWAIGEPNLFLFKHETTYFYTTLE